MTELELLSEIQRRQQAEEDLNKRLQMLTTLRQVDEELNHTLDVEYVLTMGIDAALRLSRADAGAIALMEGSHLRPAQQIGAYEDAALENYLNIDNGIVRRVIEEGEMLFVADVTSAPDATPLLPKIQAQLLVPLFSRDNLIGLLLLEARSPDRFTDAVLEFVKLLAARISVSVDNARLYNIAQRQLAQLQAAHDQVSKLEQLKTDMIRVAAHDLRNPLSVISGYLQLISEHCDDLGKPDLLYFIDSMMRSARQMQRIVNDILSLQRIEALVQGVGQPLDLCQVVKRVLQENQEQKWRESHQFELEVHPAPVLVRGDPSFLQEVVANLISNAIKYTPTGGRVSVSLRVGDGKARFQVEDTGFGIPDDQKERLFQPFYRVSTKETKKIDGTGLGLYLARRVVEQFGGRMIFHSVYGEGSTFGFEMTLVNLADEEQPSSDLQEHPAE